MTCTRLHHRLLPRLLVGTLALAPAGVVCAGQASVQPVQLLAPPPVAQFQQAVQQQQVTNQLQQSQLEQQLHQSVTDNAKSPGANDPLLQSQLNQASQAQRDRDRAAQQDALDRYRSQAALPRVIPDTAPAVSRSGG